MKKVYSILKILKTLKYHIFYIKEEEEELKEEESFKVCTKELPKIISIFKFIKIIFKLFSDS